MPVGSYQNGQSVYGVYDLVGNVWEWTNSLYRSYPYIDTDGRENPVSADLRVIRGGSWFYDEILVRSSARSKVEPSATAIDIGFRCARDMH